MKETQKVNIEGLIVKRNDSKYVLTDSRLFWTKLKN